MARLTPRNDAEANVLVYQSLEESLAKALRRIAKTCTGDIFARIRGILEDAGWDGSDRSVLVRPASPDALRRITEIADRCSPEDRRRIMSRVMGQVSAGKLTVGKAVKDIIRWGAHPYIETVRRTGRAHLTETAREAMLRGEFLVQKSVGIGWTADTLDTKSLESFVSRQWTRNDALSWLRPLTGAVEEEYQKGIILGENPRTIANRVRRAEDIGRVSAEREARTVTNAVANEAHMESYKRHNVKRYKVVATWDERTCPVCGQMDGKTYPIDERQSGRTSPPFHPNCRCTTVAALSEELKKRLAEESSVTYQGQRIPSDAGYDWWHRNYGPGRH